LQERQQVLFYELQHRTRNRLAVVQSIAQRLCVPAARFKTLVPSWRGARALSRVQGCLKSIELRALVEAEVTAHLERGSHEVVVQAARRHIGSDAGTRAA
jgi:hypothetical protein